MSVVNQMLKDLEDRKVDDAGYSAVYEPSNKTKKSVLLPILIVVLLLLVGILSWIGYQHYYVQQEKDTVIERQKSTTDLATQSKDLSTAASNEVTEPLDGDENKARPMANVAAPKPMGSMTRKTDDAVINPTPVEKQPISTTSIAATANNNPQLEQPIAAKPLVDNTPKMTVQKSSIKTPPVETTDFSKQASGSQSTGTSLREQALAALRAGQDALGIQLLSQLTQLEPDNIAAHKKLAAVLYSQNQSIRATAVLEDGIRISPQDPDLRLMLARLLTQNNENNRALTVITPSLPLIGKSTEFLGFRAALAEQLNVHNVAHDDYLQLSSEQPNESRWWLGLGISSERIEARQMALEAYQRVVALNQLGAEVQSFAQQRINQLARSQ